MEVFVVNSLDELRRLVRVFRHFPSVLFTGGYIRVQVLVGRIDLLRHVVHYNYILAARAETLLWEVPSQEFLKGVSQLVQPLLSLEAIVDDVTDDTHYEQMYDVMGDTAMILQELSLDNGGRLGDSVFDLANTAIKLSNAALALLRNNSRGLTRWKNLINALNNLLFDISFFLDRPLNL